MTVPPFGQTSCGSLARESSLLDACYAMLNATVAGEEELEHRVLVVVEAAGLGETAVYLVRSLLSEGRVRYQTVDKGPEGLRGRWIERPHPPFQGRREPREMGSLGVPVARGDPSLEQLGSARTPKFFE